MPKPYCIQNNGNCSTCSLVNYGLDCRNVALKESPRRLSKIDRATIVYDGFKGTQAVKAVLDQIPPELQDRLTARELGMVMSVVNKAYHNGRSSTGAEVIDGEMIWVNKLNRMFDLHSLEGLS